MVENIIAATNLSQAEALILSTKFPGNCRIKLATSEPSRVQVFKNEPFVES